MKENFNKVLSRLLERGEEAKKLRENQVKALQYVKGGKELIIPVLRGLNIIPDSDTLTLGVIRDRSWELVNMINSNPSTRFTPMRSVLVKINKLAETIDSKKDVNFSWGCVANDCARAEKKLTQVVQQLDELIGMIDSLSTPFVEVVADVPVPEVETPPTPTPTPKKKSARKSKKAKE